MSGQAEVERLKQKAVFNLYSGRVGVTVSVVISLAMIAILSKNRVNHWLLSLAIAVPIFLGLYFRNRLALLGPFVYASGLIGILVLAVLFGL